MAEEEVNRNVIVIDNGGEFLRAGFGGADDCSFEIPNVVAGSFVGDEALERSDLEWIWPVQNEKIEDWDAMEKVLLHVFQKLKIEDVSKIFVFMSESGRNPRIKREQTGQLLLDKLGVAGMYLQNSGLLALYASGRTDGIVLDTGADTCRALPVSKGYPIVGGMRELPIGARKITEVVHQLLTAKGLERDKKSSLQLARKIKEQFSYVALDMDPELEKFDSEPEKYSKKFSLPDEKEIMVGSEQVVAGEILFQPEIAGVEASGCAQFLFDAIQDCPIDSRTDLYENIVLSGGSTLMPGFGARLQADLEQVCPKGIDIKVSDGDHHATWIGGSIVAGLGSFQDKWVTRKEWASEGKSIISKKCQQFDEGVR